ncbi:hypothetical protein PUNSTDRAFT_130518 [Punctularia strigosozonata HHB-11173 SS5]|uniref:uncharacterized protein n=1 Tax=Punctularia strigosozonata (strain HHB-11173) TaxID=741275 RepID=UPI000441865D|nr:uncharacterized protein PUNSTDRAFT_130518 [Punctularia strigosozonata HHB-11173 SS5]EIN12252.1 hypothetical protein PUNSTDRAFT_130518 [Punctularia strigosozonata HHB-11173 SS5]
MNDGYLPYHLRIIFILYSSLAEFIYGVVWMRQTLYDVWSNDALDLDVSPHPVVRDELSPLHGSDVNRLMEETSSADVHEPYDPLVGNPWFLEWRSRREEAQQLAVAVRSLTPLTVFECEPIVDYHMGNFHRLHFACGVTAYMYVQRVLWLGEVPMPSHGPMSNKRFLRSFIKLYERWSGIVVSATEAPPSVTDRISLPSHVDLHSLWDRRDVDDALKTEALVDIGVA